MDAVTAETELEIASLRLAKTLSANQSHLIGDLLHILADEKSRVKMAKNVNTIAVYFEMISTVKIIEKVSNDIRNEAMYDHEDVKREFG